MIGPVYRVRDLFSLGNLPNASTEGADCLKRCEAREDRDTLLQTTHDPFIPFFYFRRMQR